MANENRLIDAKDFDLRVSQKKMTEVFPNWNELPKEVQDAVCKHAQHLHMLLETQPTIEAEPVVHGRWIRKGNKNECDQCGFFYYSSRADYRRCPKCEAKMDLKEAHHEPLR